MSLYDDSEFKRVFIDTCRFADESVSIVCSQRAHKVAMYTAIRAVLAAQVLTLTGREDEAQTILAATYSRVSGVLHSPKEMCDVIMRISTTLHAFAASKVKSVDNYITIAKLSKQFFLAKKINYLTNSEIILIEHIRKLHPEISSFTDMILKEMEQMYRDMIFFFWFLLILFPAGLNIWHLGLNNEPHALWFFILALCPGFSLLVFMYTLLVPVLCSCSFWAIPLFVVFAFIGFCGYFGWRDAKKVESDKIASMRDELDFSIKAQQTHNCNISDNAVVDASAHSAAGCGVADDDAFKPVNRSVAETVASGEMCDIAAPSFASERHDHTKVSESKTKTRKIKYLTDTRVEEGIKWPSVPKVRNSAVTRVPLPDI